ncbi:hypothetical protein JHK82_055603 [Glycine max]|nr:hypothetical protein JHK86_055429 [Glycine max]KAG4918160.1 hypothetical protein JHK85_056441 [Glycine max]KAG5074237.1 hypothetical protein JHK84_055468 [Glycine max]KAG5076908.1 hypothetical protein JHK82_055603 [Glycine max]
MDVMRFKYGIGISLVVALKARMIAKAIVDGDAIRQYSYLEAYGEELKLVCEGKNYKLILKRPPGLLLPRFGSSYTCLEGSKLTFKRVCKPIIGLDGCHLKSKFGGQLLIVVGRDPNDQYLPIAFPLGLVQTLQETRASDENQFCLRHLYQSFKKQFGGGTLLRDLMIGATKATYKEA